MDMYFIFEIILGIVLYNVAEVSTQPEWDNQFLNNMQRWFDSFQHQSALANENGDGVGDQTASNPFNQLVSEVAQGLVPCRDNKTNSYDLKDAMELLNASFGFPAVADNNTTHNESDQVAAFSALFHAAANAFLEPESIPDYLNLLKNASANPSLAIDDTITITSDALTKQFQKEYEVALSRFEKALHSNKTSDTKGVSQNHTNDVVSNINNQLSRMPKFPEDGN